MSASRKAPASCVRFAVSVCLVFLATAAPAHAAGTTTSVDCSPSPVTVNSPTTCTATVTDTDIAFSSNPTGTVSFSSSGIGTFSGTASCDLLDNAIPGQASCSVTYTPTASGSQTITGSYSGDLTHDASSGSTIVEATKRTTTTGVRCKSSSVAVYVPLKCTATVTDTDSGTQTTPTGTVSFSTSGSGSFSNSGICSLTRTYFTNAAHCTVTYTSTAVGSHTLTALYGGDDAHDTSSGASALTVTSPIRHVVVIYPENHSFDNVLGAWCVSSGRCNGTTQGKLPDGRTVALRTSPDIVPAMPHSTGAQTTSINGGKMDGFAKLTGCGQQYDYACLSQFTPSQIPNLIALAENFAVSDRTFQLSSIPSFGSHIELVAATLDGFTGDIPHTGTAGAGAGGWGCDSLKDAAWRSGGGTVSDQPACIPDYGLDAHVFPYGGAYKPTKVKPVPTIMDLLDQAALSWKLYTATQFVQNNGYSWAICPTFASCLNTPQHANQVDREQLFQDTANGTLPNFSVVLPDAAHSQHNKFSMALGDNWIGQVVGAIEAGPDWSSTAIFIMYDDCGCFYDHVPPPPGFGIRTPMVIVSPWVRPSYTDTMQASWASPLAFTEHNLGLPPLGGAARDRAAYDFRRSFNFSQQPTAPVRMTTTRLPLNEILQLQQTPPDDDDT
jgi:phospholipase C